MILFWLLAGVMVLAGLAWVLPALLRRQTGAQDMASAQAAIYRDKLQELDVDRANNTLSDAEYQQAKSELEREALTALEAIKNQSAQPRSGKGNRFMALGVALLVPVVAVLLYAQLGQWRSIGQPAQQASVLPPNHPDVGAMASGGEGSGKLPSVQALMSGLIEHLQTNPDDAAGWILLGHSYRSLARYDRAAQAYHKAMALGRNEPELAAMYEETLAMAGPQPAQEPATGLLDRILQLQAQLADNPNDAEAWAALGRAYSLMNKYADAVQAYAKATAQITDSADLWADYADALASVDDTGLSGRPMQLVHKALALNPDHVKALWLAGTEAHNRQDYQAAIKYWQHLQRLLDPAGRDARIIQANIDEARRLLGQPVQAATRPSPEQASGIQEIRGHVQLAPGLKGKVPADATVFIYARAAQGPRMPLAVLRKQVKDLPVDFVLNDSLAMSPAMKLSAFNDVVVSAHISRSGSAVRSSGDLEARAQSVTGEQKTPVTLTIADTVP
jgi:cytochrome c-type biogenesis protein CcmI